MNSLNPPIINYAPATQANFLTLADWQTSFPILKQPNINLICNFMLNQALKNSDETTVVDHQSINNQNINNQVTNINTNINTNIDLMFNSLCHSTIGCCPPLVIVEHPWQAQWLKQRCMIWFKSQVNQFTASNKVLLMPQVLTLNQHLESLNGISNQLLPTISKQEAALLLCDALKQLNVDSIRSDTVRYQLAIQMLTLIQEIDTRALLSDTLANAGQTAQNQLLETTFLSREVQWVSVCQQYLSQIETATGRQLHWRKCLHHILEQTLITQNLKLIIPAPHPGLMMQVFLSQLCIESINNNINNDIDNDIDNNIDNKKYIKNNTILSIILPDLSVNTTLQATQIQTYSCTDFEDEAQCAAQHIQSWFKSGAKHIVVVAHDRVLGRRCAALLARNMIPVEDRVGWALSTTVAASTVRGVLTSWLSSDFEALLAWLALPMVQSHQAGAVQTLIYLQHVWYKQKIIPDGKALIQRILNHAFRVVADTKQVNNNINNINNINNSNSNNSNSNNNNNGNINTNSNSNSNNSNSNNNTETITNSLSDSVAVQLAVAQCLGTWQAGQTQSLKRATVSTHAQQLMAYLALLAPALQQDNAGIKVWQQLQLLAISPQLSEDNHSPKITLATFMSVLDHSFETERFSVSTHRYDSPDTARVIFMPFYEVAWSHCQHILMMACNDVHFPATPNNPTPLLASVRRELNIPLPIAERAVWLHLLLNMNSQSQVYASFTPSESGNPSRISPWLNGVSAHIKPSALQVVSVNNNIGLFQSHTQPPKKLYQSYLTINHLPTDISVSRLSKLLQCPYHFALETIFNIKPLNQPDIWPSYSERGNLLHAVLHKVHRHLEHNNILDTNSTSDLIHAIHQAMQDLLQDKVYLSGRYTALIADCERTIITYISAHQAQLKNNWQIAATEMPLDSHHLIHNVRVHGKIDRLQVQQNNQMNQTDVYAVLDYKTSSQDSLRKKIKQPLLDAQLTLYAVLLTLSGKKIEQAAYWRLHDGLFNDEDSWNTDYHSKKTIVSVDDLPLQMEVLSKTLHTEWQILLAGKASTRPNVDTCQYCDYSGVCRNAQLIEMADEESGTLNFKA